MRISARILVNVVNVNYWRYGNQAIVREGQINEIYFKLVNLDQSVYPNEKNSLNPENPIRYMSQANSIIVQAAFDSLDSNAVLNITATQPFVDDKSIFKLTLNANQLPSSGNFKITINEDGSVKTFIVKQAISVETLNLGGC
jgi:hypothetical protein